MNSATNTKPAAFTESDAAALMGCPVKALRSRLVALGYTKVCGRCLGSGRYSFNQMDGDRCFGCSGVGRSMLPVTRARIVEAIARIEAGELADYFARAEAYRAARAQIKPLVAEAAALYAPIAADYETAYRAGTLHTTDSPVWYAQTMANALFYGVSSLGVHGKSRGVREIESDISHGRDRRLVASVAEMAERVESLRTLNAAWLAAR